MKFNLGRSLDILRRTPTVLKTLLENIHEDWGSQNEGKETWSPFDVVGHLIHGEKTDWMQRTEIILSGAAKRSFEPFNRFAQYENSKGKSMDQLLEEFEELRKTNLKELEDMKLTEEDFDKTGTHPELGEVTLRQLLATWTVHDLNHIHQIVRTMSSQFKDETGPWLQYLGILNKK